MGNVVTIQTDLAQIFQSKERIGFDDGEIVLSEGEILYGLWKITQRNLVKTTSVAEDLEQRMISFNELMYRYFQFLWIRALKTLCRSFRMIQWSFV